MNDDVRFMQRALALAERGAGHVSPNPLVGAVVVRDGIIVGEGWHARFGGDHAEVAALRDAGVTAHGATAYITLEPCNHQGKTPPCTRALLDAQIARVVFAVNDPNAAASGGGAFLAQHGVAVEQGVLEREARDLNAPFLFARTHSQRPFVTLKLATSVDGAIVDASRERGWLTSEESRRVVHALRAQADGVAVGIGTALADNPALTVREAEPPRVPPQRVVFDRQARLPLESALVSTAGEVPVVVIADGSAPEREAALVARGVTVLRSHSLADSLQQLRNRGIEHLLVEGGATLASALMDAELVDRLITFQAPVILGAGALPAFTALPSKAAGTAPRMRVIARREIGADLMTIYAVSGD